MVQPSTTKSATTKSATTKSSAAKSSAAKSATTKSSAADTTAAAGRREWLGLAVLTLPTLLVAIDIGALFLALPRLSADLGASSTSQLWITDSYGFMLAGFLVTMGNVGDRVGRRRLLLIGAVAFTIASVLAAYSTSAGMLIAARALLGIAAATLSPSTLALISNMFRDERERGRAISLWATCQFAGAAFGPVVGGLLLDHFWWGSVFLLAVPVMVALLVLGPVLLPEYRNPHAGPLDLISVALSLGAILPIVYVIKALATSTAATEAGLFGDPARLSTTGLVGAVGVGCAALFLRRQQKLATPLLDVALVRQPGTRTALIGMMVAAAALAGTNLLTTQYVQIVGDLSASMAGVLQAPTGLGIAAGTLVAPWALRRLKPTTAIVIGLSCSAAGMLVVAHAGTRWLGSVVVAIAVVAFGVGPLFVIGTGTVVGSAPPERAGAAASLSETSNLLGSNLGFALLGSLGAAAYQAGMSDASLAGVSPGDAAAVQETVASASAVAAHLPPSAAAELMRASGEAFTTAMNVTAAVATVILVALAATIARGRSSRSRLAGQD